MLCVSLVSFVEVVGEIFICGERVERNVVEGVKVWVVMGLVFCVYCIGMLIVYVDC